MSLMLDHSAELQMSPIKFDVTPEEFDLLTKITSRGVTMAMERANVHWDFQQCIMDLTACHCNGCPLKLLSLFLSNDMDFAQDFAGICNNIDRATGKLMNGFTPTFKAESRH